MVEVRISGSLRIPADLFPVVVPAWYHFHPCDFLMKISDNDHFYLKKKTNSGDKIHCMSEQGRTNMVSGEVAALLDFEAASSGF